MGAQYSAQQPCRKETLQTENRKQYHDKNHTRHILHTLRPKCNTIIPSTEGQHQLLDLQSEPCPEKEFSS